MAKKAKRQMSDALPTNIKTVEVVLEDEAEDVMAEEKDVVADAADVAAEEAVTRQICYASSAKRRDTRHLNVQRSKIRTKMREHKLLSQYAKYLVKKEARNTQHV